jgi:tRNA(Ile)-lysidine synthase
VSLHAAGPPDGLYQDADLTQAPRTSTTDATAAMIARAGPWPSSGPLPEGRPRGALVDEVRRVLRPLPQRAAVLIATSGGPDSAALSFLTSEARPDLQITLGHVRHGLRDDAADAAVVAAHASWLGVEHLVAHVHVAGEGGMEASARAHRYAALRRQAADVGAGWIVLGHTAEDQAETVLLRILRGTGVSGLAAMSPMRGGLVRPMLRLRRNDVARFVLHEGLPIAKDPTNADESIARVRVRQRLLPMLAEFGGDAVATIARLADLARADSAALDRLAAEVTDRALVRYGPAIAVRDGELALLEPALAARVLRAAVTAARSTDDPPTAAQVADLAGLSVGSAVDLPDVTATRGGGWIGLVARDLPTGPVRSLRVPGVTGWPTAGVELHVVTEEAVDDDGQLRLEMAGGWSPPAGVADLAAIPPGGDRALGRITVGSLPTEPVVRPRRPGDRVVTHGGTRKLQDVFVDAGVPRAIRDLLPVVAAGERVLWVPGIVADESLLDEGRRAPRAVLTVRVPAR